MPRSLFQGLWGRKEDQVHPQEPPGDNQLRKKPLRSSTLPGLGNLTTKPGGDEPLSESPKGHGRFRSLVHFRTLRKNPPGNDQPSANDKGNPGDGHPPANDKGKKDWDEEVKAGFNAGTDARYR